MEINKEKLLKWAKDNSMVDLIYEIEKGTFKMPERVKCTDCNGDGFYGMWGLPECSTCHGEKYVWK